MPFGGSRCSEQKRSSQLLMSKQFVVTCNNSVIHNIVSLIYVYIYICQKLVLPIASIHVDTLTTVPHSQNKTAAHITYPEYPDLEDRLAQLTPSS